MMEGMEVRKVLVPIGWFSKMTRLSVKALRLYDENGLLPAARVDSSSGYRWISENGYEIAGPPREIYLSDPQAVVPEELLTRVELPICPEARGDRR